MPKATKIFDNDAKKKTVRRAKKTVRAKKSTLPVNKVRKTPQEQAAIRERQESALELRMAGTPYKDIAAALGYANPASAKKACDSAIRRVQIDAAKEVVAMDLARLDEFQMRCMHSLRTNGDLGQIDRILRIMDWRYRLLGVTDETVRALQSEHGIHTTNNTNNVMVVQARPDTEHEFIAKMMKSVGVDPESDEAKQLMKQYDIDPEARTLPMLEGSANSDREKIEAMEKLDAADIVDAEIVE